MPQATPELRKKWGGEQGVGEDKAMDYLATLGYRLNRKWSWMKPSPEHQPTVDELEAIEFLIQEWDFGGLI